MAAWAADQLCTPTTWTDYISGRVLNGSGGPIVGSDPGFYNGRVAAHTTRSPLAYWANNALASLAPIGARPYLAVVGRFKTVPPTGDGFLISGRQTSNIGAVGLGDTASVQRSNPVEYGAFINRPVPDTTSHAFESWADGTLGHFRIDRVDNTQAQTTALTSPLTQMAFGQSAGGGGYGCNASLTFVMICTQLPSPEDVANWQADVKAIWALP